MECRFQIDRRPVRQGDLNGVRLHRSRHGDTLKAARSKRMRRTQLNRQTAQLDDPLRGCVAKFNGQWRTGSGQFDVTTAYLDGN